VSWEVRRPGGPRFYTRKTTVGGRPTRQYVGGGIAGQAAAAVDALLRAERQAQAGARRAERERLRRADAPVLALDEALGVLTGAALVISGYHRHGGEWRRGGDGS
jgi:hypothetical protein